MPTKTMCALVAVLFCIPAIAADKKPLTAKQKELARDAREVLGVYCGKCHAKGGSDSGDMLINYNWLKGQNTKKKEFFIPFKPDESLLYTIIKKGKMPKDEELANLPDGKFPAEKLKVIEDWIKEGALPWPPGGTPLDPPIPHRDMTSRMLADLKKQKPRKQQFIRYFTLTHLMNAGEKKDAMHNYRTALSKLVNSLSNEREIKRPEPIDAQNDIFRINLRAYGWNQAKWHKITSNTTYPYPYIVDLNFREQDQLRKLAATDIPHIRADWFIAHGARPELYHEILKLPETVRALETELKVDVDENIRNGVDDEHFLRAGFLQSGVSKFNRIVERHKIPRGGGYWKSYDFNSNIDRQNIFRYPLGPVGVKDEGGKENFFDQKLVFKHAGGEIIFSLPNGLQGYLLVNSEGNRINQAPLGIVQDLDKGLGRDPVIRNGISCMACHNRGMKPLGKKAGHLRQSIDLADAAKVAKNFDKQAALKLLSTAEEINEIVEKDTKRFLKAMEETADYENTYFAVRGGVVGSKEPIALLTKHYEGALNKRSAAGELGVKADDLEKRIKLVAELQQYGLQALLVKDGPGVARESWENNYVNIYRYVTEPYEIPRVEFPLTLKTTIPDPPRFSGRLGGVVAWSHDQNSSTLFSSGKKENVPSLFRWDAINWQPRPENPPIPFDNQKRSVFQMEFNPTDPTRLALINSGANGLLSLEILDIARPNKVIKRLQEDQGQFTSFAWSPDGKKIAVTFSRRGPRVGITGVKVLDAITYKVLFGRAIGGARGLDWSPDGKQLAITITVLGGFNGPASSVEIWNEELKKKHKAFGNTGGGSPDWGPEKKNKRRDDPFSSRIAMGNRRGGTVTIVEVGIKEGDENKPGDLQELTFSMPKCSNAVHEFDLRNRSVGDKTSSVVAWSADGKRLARGSQRDVIIWDSDNLNVLHEFKVDFPVNSLAWRSDGRMIAAGNNSGSVRVFKDIK